MGLTGAMEFVHLCEILPCGWILDHVFYPRRVNLGIYEEIRVPDSDPYFTKYVRMMGRIFWNDQMIGKCQERIKLQIK